MYTSEVAHELGVSEPKLRYALAAGRIPKPPVDCAGIYRWTAEHIDRARQHFEAAPGRGRKPAPAEIAR